MKIKTKERSYQEVMALPVPAHRKPMKQWFLFRLILRIASIPDLFLPDLNVLKLEWSGWERNSPA